MKLEEAVDFFDAQAAAYDAAYDAPGPDGYALRTRLAAVLEALGPGPGDALDAGMGPGRLCEALAHEGWTVTGVDPSRAMVDHARRRLRGAAAEIVAAPIGELPFREGAYDAVVATGVLEYVPDVGRAISELARVLRAGGRLVLTVPNAAAANRLWRRHVFYPVVRAVKRRYVVGGPPPVRRERPPAPREVVALLARSDVVVERRTPLAYHAFLSPLDVLAPHPTTALSRALERRRILARVLATQVLYVARKR